MFWKPNYVTWEDVQKWQLEAIKKSPTPIEQAGLPLAQVLTMDGLVFSWKRIDAPASRWPGQLINP